MTLRVYHVTLLFQVSELDTYLQVDPKLDESTGVETQSDTTVRLCLSMSVHVPNYDLVLLPQ